MKLVTRGALIRLAVLLTILGGLGVAAWTVMLRMPGEPYAGVPPPARGELTAELRRDVEHLCGDGERNVFHGGGLAAAAAWLEAELTAAGYAPRRQVYRVNGTECANVEATLAGGAEIVVVGAHYDTVPGSPGANDNGSGVAATLALARRFAGRIPGRTLRFVFFANEEPPFFQTEDMGSLRYARRCRAAGDRIAAMISLETLGYFTDAPDSQRYPFGPLRAIYGDRGDYVGFVADVGSGALVREALEVFRAHATIPSHGVAFPGAVPGVGWSDHWSFWQCDYPAFMVTDTAPYRYPHYHRRTDTPDRLCYDELARVVEALVPVVAHLVRAPRAVGRPPPRRAAPR